MHLETKMKTFKEILDEARMIATGDYKISSSGRKVRRLIKIGDDDYNRADDIDKDGDVDADDMKRKKMTRESAEQVDEKRGLWDNIHAKRERIKNGSGEHMRKPGSKGAPTAADFKASQNEEVEQIDEISDKTLGNYINAARKDREHNKINKAAPDSAQRAHANERDKKRIAGMNKAKSYLTPGTAGHAKNQARRAMHEDAEQIEEAVSVKKQDYSWGKMVTVHHGADTSYPLHPEHQEKIKNLKDGEKTSFKDETNSTVHAHREGESVHLTRPKTSSTKTTVAHSHFTESVELVPFDKPYRKVKSDVVIDKSGAKHGPMSRARNLARMAALQQQKKAKK